MIEELAKNGINNEHRGDLVSQIAELCDAANKSHYLKLPGDDRHILMNPDGTIKDIYVPPRSYVAQSIDGLVQQVCDLSSILDDDGQPLETRVFVGGKEIVVLYAERDHRAHRTEMGLDYCDSFDKLENHGLYLDKISQASLVELLKTDFKDAVNPNTFTAAIRKLRFNTNSSGNVEIRHGKETFDAEVERDLAGMESALPEELVIETSVYEDLASSLIPPKFQIKCAFLIDVQNQKFTIKPYEGEVMRAKTAALHLISKMIRSGISKDRGMEDEQLPDTIIVFDDSRC